jgi:hypothetical protein
MSTTSATTSTRSHTSSSSSLTHVSRAPAVEPIQPTTLSTKRKVLVELPEPLWKRKRRLKSVEIEEPESEEESYDVRKRTKLGRDMLNLSDDESLELLDSEDSPPPTNFKIGPPRGVNSNKKVKTKKRAITSSKVSAPSSTSTIATGGIYDVIPEVPMKSSESRGDAEGSQTDSLLQSAKFKSKSRAPTSASPPSSQPSSDDDVPLVHKSRLRVQISAPPPSSPPSNDQAPASETVCLPSSNEPPTSQPINLSCNTKSPVASTPTCAPEDKSVVPDTETQGNTMSPFQLRPASFSLSPDSANDHTSEDQRLEPKPEESSISGPIVKQNLPSSIEESSSPSKPLHDREENPKHRLGDSNEIRQRVEELVAAAAAKRRKERGEEGVETRRLEEVSCAEGIDEEMDEGSSCTQEMLVQEMENTYREMFMWGTEGTFTDLGVGDGNVGQSWPGNRPLNLHPVRLCYFSFERLTQPILQPDIDAMTSTLPNQKSVEISKLEAALEQSRGEAQRLTDDNARLRDSSAWMNTMANNMERQLIDSQGQLADLKAKHYYVLCWLSYYTSALASIVNKK